MSCFGVKSRPHPRTTSAAERTPTTAAPAAYHAGMYSLWLFLHVLGAIVAFGFAFYAPIFGAMVAKEPQHGNWFLRAAKRVSDILVIPVAVSMSITGVLLVTQTGGFKRFGELWLAVALILYVIALLVVFLLQRPTLKRVIALTSEPAGTGGPPAEVPVLLGRMRLYGGITLLLIIAIVALMVAKPQL